MWLCLILVLWSSLAAAELDDWVDVDDEEFIAENYRPCGITPTPSIVENDHQTDKSNHAGRSVTTLTHHREFRKEVQTDISQPQITLCHVALAIFAASRILDTMLQHGSKMLGCDSFPGGVQPHGHTNMPTLVQG